MRATEAAPEIAEILHELDGEELPLWRDSYQAVIEDPRSNEHERKAALAMRTVINAAMRGIPFEESLSVIAGANEKARPQDPHKRARS